MWQKENCKKPKMLPLGQAIPLHVGSFLKLGLQPELSDRREMDLQEIYLMLRLQTAAVSHSQQKESYLKSNNAPPLAHLTTTSQILGPSQIQPQHGWDAVKERLKKRITPPPPPPPLPPPPSSQQPTRQKEDLSKESVEEGDTEEQDVQEMESSKAIT